MLKHHYLKELFLFISMILQRYTSQQLTFENIIHDFTQQATAVKKTNKVKVSFFTSANYSKRLLLTIIN